MASSSACLTNGFARLSTEKRLNIIYSGKKMLERCCKGAHSSVKNYFKAFPNVRIYADQKVVDTDQDCLVTDKVRTFISRPISATMFPDPIQERVSNLTIRQGDRIPTDVAYCGVGFVPNTDFMKANFAELLTPKGHIKVNEHLQVKQNRFPSLTLKVRDALALSDQLATRADGGLPQHICFGRYCGHQRREAGPGSLFFLFCLGRHSQEVFSF